MSENLADKAMHEHSRLIRESPSYRNFLMMEELMAEMQPPLSSGELPDSNNISNIDKNGMGEGRGIGGLLRGDFIEYTGRYKELSKIGYDEGFQRNRRGIIAELHNLEGKINYIQSKLNEHLDKSKKPKSIWTNDGHEMDKV